MQLAMKSATQGAFAGTSTLPLFHASEKAMARSRLSPFFDARYASSGTPRGPSLKSSATPDSVVDVYQRQPAAGALRCSLRQKRFSRRSGHCTVRTSTT
jgi:hypothetical protein